MLPQKMRIQGALSYGVSQTASPTRPGSVSRDPADRASRAVFFPRSQNGFVEAVTRSQRVRTRLQGRGLPEAVWILEIPSGCFDSALQIVFVGDRVVALRST